MTNTIALRHHRLRILLSSLVIALVTIGCGQRDETHNISALGGDHAAQALASWIGRAILDKLFDEVTFQSKKQEIRTDLELFDAALARVDEKLSNRIRDLRKQLESKASIEDVRRIVDETVAELESRVQQADRQVTSTEARVRELETIIGYVPTVTPSPLLRINANGKPEAHPLTVKWANLLSSSHVHWIEMEKLNLIYKSNAPEMKAAVERHRKFQQEAMTLRQDVKQQLAVSLAERMKLLETRRPNHPAVRDFDAGIGSLTWLAKIVQIEEEGAFKGMLVVPEQLVGPAASDIIAAFELGGAETKDLVPLYSKLLHLLPVDKKDESEGEAARPEVAWHLLPVDKNGDSKLFESQQEKDAQKKFLALNRNARATLESAERVDGELRNLRKDHSDLHPRVVALNKERVVLLSRIKNLQSETDTIFALALRVYVENLKVYRHDHATQKRLNGRFLKPLVELRDKTHCFDWENAEALNATWSNFIRQGEFFGPKQSAQDDKARKAFLSGTPEERVGAAWYLGDNALLSDELIVEAIPLLRASLSSDDVQTRYWGVCAMMPLETLHEQMSVEMANMLLLPPGRTGRDFKTWYSICEKACDMLGQLGHRAKHVLPILETTLPREVGSFGDGTSPIIIEAIYQIGALEDRHIAIIRVAIEKGDYSDADRRAVALAGKIKPARAELVGPLTSRLANSSSFTDGVLAALGEMGPAAATACPVIEKFVVSCHDEKQREAAIDALQKIRVKPDKPKASLEFSRKKIASEKLP